MTSTEDESAAWPAVTLSQDATQMRQIVGTESVQHSLRLAALFVDRHLRLDVVAAGATAQRGNLADLFVAAARAVRRQGYHSSWHSLSKAHGPQPMPVLALAGLLVTSQPDQVLLLHEAVPHLLDRFLEAEVNRSQLAAVLRAELEVRFQLVAMATHDADAWSSRSASVRALLDQAARLQGALDRCAEGTLKFSAGGFLDLHRSSSQQAAWTALRHLARLVCEPGGEDSAREAAAWAAQFPGSAEEQPKPGDDPASLGELYRHLKLMPLEAVLRGATVAAPVSPGGTSLGWRAPPPFTATAAASGQPQDRPEDFQL